MTRLTLVALLLLGAALPATAADWYDRVRDLGLEDASARDVALFEGGRLPADLHIGSCYVHLRKFAEAAEVFRGLRGVADRNYVAAAMVHEAESLYKAGRHADAGALFRRCLDEHPEAYLDVDIPELCRAWIEKIGAEKKREALGGRKASAPRTSADAARSEALEKEIDALERRIAELKARLERLR